MTEGRTDSEPGKDEERQGTSSFKISGDSSIYYSSIFIDGIPYIGILDIQGLSLTLPVIAEWSEENGKIAPCRYSGYAKEHNLIIAGHNYQSHFSGIKTLETGEKIIFTDTQGTTYLYQVTKREILNKEDTKEILEGNWDLTLFTCSFGGEKRIVIRCEKVRKDEMEEEIAGEGV